MNQIGSVGGAQKMVEGGVSERQADVTGIHSVVTQRPAHEIARDVVVFRE